MTAPKRRPAGRLPARVYWFRRALVLGTVLVLVFVLARVLTGSSDTSAPTAARASGATTSSPHPSAAAGPLGPVAVGTTGNGVPTGTATGTAPTVGLAQPDGPCAIDEVTVTPQAARVTAGAPIALTLQLTGIRPACTFAVSPDSVVAKVTAGTKRIWSSQDCPHAVTPSSVVVRSGTPTTVQVGWSGRYSDAQCSRSSDWALPGTYQLAASAIGSEPGEATLTLVSPPRPTVTRTIYPKQKKAITNRKGTTKTPATGRRTR
jgi:hypothetical protein